MLIGLSRGVLGLACANRCRLMSGCRRCLFFPAHTFLLILTIGVCFFFSVKDIVVIENQTRQQQTKTGITADQSTLMSSSLVISCNSSPFPWFFLLYKFYIIP